VSRTNCKQALSLLSLSDAMLKICSGTETIVLPKYAWCKSPFINYPPNFALSSPIGAVNVSRRWPRSLSGFQGHRVQCTETLRHLIKSDMQTTWYITVIIYSHSITQILRGSIFFYHVGWYSVTKMYVRHTKHFGGPDIANPRDCKTSYLVAIFLFKVRDVHYLWDECHLHGTNIGIL
jgi:hypothetical protein